MAAYSSTQAGLWSSTATWGGVGPPGSGDSATLNNAVTANASVTVGPSSTSTAAITLAAGGSLAITSGTFAIKGFVFHAAANTTVTVSAGVDILIVQFNEYYVNFNSQTGAFWYFNGTSASPCSLTVSPTSSPGFMEGFASGCDAGVVTASYLNVSYMGRNNQWGIGVQMDSGANTAISWTNCNFSNSNAYVQTGLTNAWDGNLTLTSLIFTSSVANTTTGKSGCFCWGSLSAAVNGTRLMQYCSFDLAVIATTTNGFSAEDCYFGACYVVATAISWPANAVARLFIIVPSNSIYPVFQNSCEDIYIGSNVTSDPHYCENTANIANNAVLKGFMFESLPGGTTYEGDIIATVNPTSANTSVMLLNWISLPLTGCIQFTGASNVNMLLSVEHCTLYSGGYSSTVQGSMELGEGGGQVAGALASYRGNFFWSSSYDKDNYKLWSDANQVNNIGLPANLNHNGSWNVNVSNPQSGGTFGVGLSGAGRGYADEFSSVPGANDLADQNPNFVNPSANLAAWGATLGYMTQSATLAYLQANPIEIITMIQSGRSGFVPQNTALAGASYPTDPSTVDASGTPWYGGTPGLGAMSCPNPTMIPYPCSILAPRQQGLSGPQFSRRYG